jgi:glycosyltransferase involved in cell wall biosynthesis
MDPTQDENHVVSIIIPTYNYGIYLSTAIQSCLNQTYKPIEIIIVDDGSTDNTKDLVKEFRDSVIYFYQKNSGVSAARNKGLELAKGHYLAFLDSDDYLTQDSIAVKMEIFEKQPDIGIVFSSTYSRTSGQEGLRYNKRFNKFKNPITSDRFYEDLLLRKIPFEPSANLMRSSLAKQFRFPTNLSNGEDIAFFVKIFFSTKGYYLPKPTAVNIRHPESLRHNVQQVKKDEFIETVFGDPFYKGALDYLRSTCTAHRYLELSRRFSLSGQTKLAKEYYLKAISENPKALFKLKYLAKIIKAYLQ